MTLMTNTPAPTREQVIPSPLLGLAERDGDPIVRARAATALSGWGKAAGRGLLDRIVTGSKRVWSRRRWR